MNKNTLIIAEGTTTLMDVRQYITDVVIPDSVTSISDYAFRECRSLTEITIPDRVTSIGKQSFSFCSNLTSITIPNSVESVDDDAFAGCTSLKSIYIDKEKDTLDLSDTSIPKDCKVYWKGEF